MNSLEDKIEKLKLSSSITKKLNSQGIVYIKDLWLLKRNNLKSLQFTDQEIKSIIISLQLEGLDLNKKIYD